MGDFNDNTALVVLIIIMGCVGVGALYIIDAVVSFN